MPCTNSPSRSRAAALALAAALAALLAAAAAPAAAPTADPCAAALVPLRPPLELAIEGPQDLALDSSDGSFWIGSALSLDILHVGADFVPEGIVTAAIPRVENPFGNHITGLAYNASEDTLFIARGGSKEIWEIDKSGLPTGFFLFLDLPRPPNIIPEPFIKSIEYDPEGDAGRGSFWVVESVMTAIYEVSREGSILQSFCHPNDPDGCPGAGRAAFANGVGLHTSAGGGAHLEIIGGTTRRDRIIEVDRDGVPTGASYPLDVIGGVPGGFVRVQAPAPEGGVRPAFVVTVESTAELHVLEIVPPRIIGVLEASCRSESGRTILEWRNAEVYEAIDIARDGAALAALPGDATSFTDDFPPAGRSEYEIVARREGCAARAACSERIGAGAVRREAVIAGLQAVDLAEDADERIWVTHASGEIAVFDKDLDLLVIFRGPFREEGDVTSGIAYNPTQDTFFVYNAATHVVGEMDGSGELVAAPFPSGVPSDPENPALVPCMLFDPAGDAGRGSFWYSDFTTGTIQERDRDGGSLRSCVHPDHAADPPAAPDARDKALVWGISMIPGRGAGTLAVTGGRAHDAVTTRIVELDTAACALVGPELAVDELPLSSVLAILRTSHGGRPVAYVLKQGPGTQSRIFEIDALAASVPAPADLVCAQRTDAPTVRIEMRLPVAADAVRIERDGVLLATVPGGPPGPFAFEDVDAPAGERVYSARLVRGATVGDDRRCRVVVGAGSIEDVRFSHPASLVHQIAHDPAARRYVAATLDNRNADKLYLFDDEDTSRIETIPSTFTLPWQVAALTLRALPGSSEILCLGWRPGAPIGADEEPLFPLRRLGPRGELRGEIMVRAPRPRGSLVVFPSGLAWDGDDDTLWLYERNSRTVVHMTLGGEWLASFVRPAPVHQDGVVDYGLALHSARGTLFLAGAGPIDHRISRLVETTRDGRPTGVEIAVGDDVRNRVRGFAVDASGDGFIVAESAGLTGVADLVRRRAFDSEPAVRGLRCARVEGGVALDWSLPHATDEVLLLRDGAEAARLAGAATSWLDTTDAACGDAPVLYSVIAHRGETHGAAAVCLAATERPFLRGDVEADSRLTITDPVAILGFLFLGGATPACLDAADVNDSGRVDLTDAVGLLNFLFLDGVAPRPPFPGAGCDPTADELSPCAQP